ncbi:MAG TPA: pilus assembly protein TadG-related protein [Candidatus Acidoferrales bacterium]|nr:pilus assembly protein TadG-related protein [Candidatus Acidoferrales bacterium]
MARKTESGQALVLGAVALVALLGVMGLAIDTGLLRYEKRLQQTGADAAAIAGANDLAYGDWQTAAQNAAAANGYTDSSANTLSSCFASGATVGTACVEVDSPPLDGPHAGSTGCSPAPSCYVEARVAVVEPTYFMKILGVSSKTVVARAVATNWSGGAGGGGGCIYTLGTPTKKITANSAGVGVSGSVILNAPTCGIVDNGNFVANGGAQLSVVAASIGVGGVYNPPSGAATVSPNPVTGMPYSGDPLYGKYPTPTIGTSLGSVKITAGSCTGAGCSGVTCALGTCTISPGTYDDICIDNNQRINFSDGGSTTGGLFVITGASTCSSNVEFEINALATVCNSTNSDCSGMPGSANAGVTFYISGSASATVDGTATVQLTAPNSGPYEGFLFYQDPADSATMTLSGNSVSFYQGAIYMPNTDATLNFGGNTNFNGQAAYTLIDVGDLLLNGNPDVSLKANYSGLANGGGPLAGAISAATLVE